MSEEEQAPGVPTAEPPAEGGDSASPTHTSLNTDPLNTEFYYYSSVLRILGATLSNDGDRTCIIPWIRKLFRPEYQSSKYLAYLVTSLLLDQALDIFREIPPEGPLPDLKHVRSEPVHAARWEIDHMWQDTLKNLPDDFQLLDCFIHDEPAQCSKDHQFDKILDQEFQLYLYLAKPYAAMLAGLNERTRVAAWLQILCSIYGNLCCSRMKAMRNDYMMALLGYVQDLRAAGPFSEYPPWKSLPPLVEAAKVAAENCAITDPTGCYANEFMSEMPMPDEGAFCYIAISGEIVLKNVTPE